MLIYPSFKIYNILMEGEIKNKSLVYYLYLQKKWEQI